MAEEAKEEKSSANAPVLSDQQKWDAEHAELVEARKAAERAVFEHRQEPTKAAIEAAEKAAAKAAGKDGNGDGKAAAKDEPKAAPKGEQFTNPYARK